MILNLLADHEAIIRATRTDADICDEKYHDMGTKDFLIGLVEQHEKMAWMIRAHIEGIRIHVTKLKKRTPSWFYDTLHGHRG